MFKDIHDKIWAVIGPVGSIIEARATALFGLVTAGVGFMDWSPLLNLFGTSTAFNQTQVIAIGAIAFVKGIFQEITRRANDPLLKVTAAADEAPEVAVAKKKIKQVLDKTPEVQ